MFFTDIKKRGYVLRFNDGALFKRRPLGFAWFDARDVVSQNHSHGFFNRHGFKHLRCHPTIEVLRGCALTLIRF